MSRHLELGKIVLNEQTSEERERGKSFKMSRTFKSEKGAGKLLYRHIN
jgi:hypothetical protein